MPNQLTLKVRLHDEANFNSFYVSDNQEIVTCLKQLLTTPNDNYIYLWGVVSSGKSHLLQALCHEATHLNQKAFYLPLSLSVSPSVLENLDQFSLVCLDELDAVAANPPWEEALFHFFNRASQYNIRLVIAASSLPSQLPLLLPDLVSRLASGIIYSLKPLNDQQKLKALQSRSRLRGFELTAEVGQYLLNHYQRDMKVLVKILDFLDAASLEAQHRLTIPFVKSVLATLSGNSEGKT